MITEMRLVPVTADSHPFASAQFHCRLSEIGYTEEEYFLSGTANVYEEGENNRPEIIFRDAPYTTRVLIRRPADKSRFSGNVVVEVLNATAMMDIDRMWVNSWKHFTRSGDVYVGITSKGHVVDALKRFDPARYAPISWANPMPERAIPPFAKGPFPFLAQYESGLFWDMQVELARLLRSEDAKNPLAGWGKRYLYLTGWSQSGSYLCRIVKSFAYLPENTGNGPLFDGYLAAGCRADVAPMNAYEAPKTNIMHCDGWPAGSVMGAREPYININTESENRVANWIGDSDQPDFKFRTYQIPASSHDSRYSLIDYYAGQGQADCKRIGMELGWRGCEGRSGIPSSSCSTLRSAICTLGCAAASPRRMRRGSRRNTPMRRTPIRLARGCAIRRTASETRLAASARPASTARPACIRATAGRRTAAGSFCSGSSCHSRRKS